jgi:uncharacterized protein (DUF1697 family)
MTRQAVLLRGINLAGRNRVPMAELREALAAEGFEDVQTYLQSGNAVVTTALSAAKLARKVERILGDRFGLDIAVVARSRAQLAQVVRHNPLGDVATNPSLYLVTFLDGAVAPAVVKKLEEVAAPGERVVVAGREIYAWHPNGAGRSKLWSLLSGRGLGVTATARNWTTVTKLLELAER